MIISLEEQLQLFVVLPKWMEICKGFWRGRRDQISQCF